MANEGCMIHQPGTENVDPLAEVTYCPTCEGETKRVTEGVGPHYGECGSGHVYLMTEAKHKRDEPNEWPDQRSAEKIPLDGSWVIAAFLGDEPGTCLIEVVRAERKPLRWVTANGHIYDGKDEVIVGWWPCPIVRMPKVE